MNAVKKNESGKWILAITINDLSALHASYMPFVEGGGLFIPSNKNYEIGDEVFILLKLLDEVEKIPFAGTVVWITPQQAQGKRAPGIGLQFNDKENDLKAKIENYLTPLLASEKVTHTM